MLSEKRQIGKSRQAKIEPLPEDSPHDRPDPLSLGKQPEDFPALLSPLHLTGVRKEDGCQHACINRQRDSYLCSSGNSTHQRYQYKET